MGIHQQNSFHYPHFNRLQRSPQQLAAAKPGAEVFSIFFFTQFPLLNGEPQQLRHIFRKGFRAGDPHTVQAKF